MIIVYQIDTSQTHVKTLTVIFYDNANPPSMQTQCLWIEEKETNTIDVLLIYANNSITDNVWRNRMQFDHLLKW